MQDLQGGLWQAGCWTAQGLFLFDDLVGFVAIRDRKKYSTVDRIKYRTCISMYTMSVLTAWRLVWSQMLFVVRILLGPRSSPLSCPRSNQEQSANVSKPKNQKRLGLAFLQFGPVRAGLSVRCARMCVHFV